MKRFCSKKRPNMSLFGFLVCLCVSVFLFVRSFVGLVGWLPQRFIRLRLEGFKVQDSGLWLLYASHAETTRSFGCCEKPKTLQNDAFEGCDNICSQVAREDRCSHAWMLACTHTTC